MKKTLRKRNGIYHAVIRIKPTDRPFEKSLNTRDKEIAQKKINEIAHQMEREAEGLAIPTKIKESAQLPIGKHQDAFLPLHPAAVDAFLDISPNNPSPAETVFKVPTIEAFKVDLEAAGIDYKDARGNKTDFHALRTTYCTLMVSTGVAPRVAQELMRHSDIKLTMKNYTDTNLLPTASAIHGLPNFATPVATPNPTLAGIGCPEESRIFEGKTFEAPNNKGLCEVASPWVSQGERWCRRRDSNPHDITRQILSLLRLPISPLRRRRKAGI